MGLAGKIRKDMDELYKRGGAKQNAYRPTGLDIAWCLVSSSVWNRCKMWILTRTVLKRARRS